MQFQLSESKAKKLYGGAIGWLTWICIGGGAAAVIKLLFSGRGSINLGPFKATWGR